MRSKIVRRAGHPGAPSVRKGLLAMLLVAVSGACGSPPPAVPVPEHPTWADVGPILRKECNSCHGGTAPTTGSALGIVYRFDFYDLTAAACGDAATAVSPARFAAAASSQIAFDITSDSASVRPAMPPLPAPWLADWEWQTLLRWSRDPQKGTVPPDNRPPTIRVTSADRTVRNVFTLSVDVDDPDQDSVVGILTLGDVTLRIDRPGSFSAVIDASQWPEGSAPMTAVLCDGWQRALYDEATLGAFVVAR
jgi:hypothetical protein